MCSTMRSCPRVLNLGAEAGTRAAKLSKAAQPLIYSVLSPVQLCNSESQSSDSELQPRRTPYSNTGILRLHCTQYGCMVCRTSIWPYMYVIIWHIGIQSDCMNNEQFLVCSAINRTSSTEGSAWQDTAANTEAQWLYNVAG